jgi:predicted nucleic acid-binding protein
MYLVDLYQPKWSAEIHDEWIRNVLHNRPDLKRAQLERTRELMNAYGGDCLVTRYRQYVSKVTLPDPDDRHVVAVAIASKAGIIVTFNLSDFPVSALADHGIEAVHPDDFVLTLYQNAPERVLGLLRLHRSALRNPPKTASEYIDTLRASGLAKFADVIAPQGDAI